jgi:hypothetical protein
MTRVIFVIVLSALFLGVPSRAIEMNGGYVTTPPTSTNVPNWNTGWGPGGTTCWSYVGTVNGGSGVYLGNGWVLTAAHIGIGNFVLSGITYPAVANSTVPIAGGDADLCLFQIATSPPLPPLPLSTSLPVAFSPTQAGTPVVMLGYGGGNDHLTWGYDIVTETNQSVTPKGTGYVSNDFETDNGTVTYTTTGGTQTSITNTSAIVVGDSGGGVFAFNNITGKWELTGINEAIGTGNIGSDGTFSAMVQLNTYAPQINAIISRPTSDTPTLPGAALWALAGLILLVAARARGKKARA